MTAVTPRPRRAVVTGHPHARRLAALSATLTAGTVLVTRPWLRTGSTRAERRVELAGDEVIARPRLVATRATTIAAPPEAVWPWLAQMGHGRAGWYGYDLWDNAGEPSADEILAGLQGLAVGDVIPDAVGPFGFEVVELQPDCAIVLRATIHPVTGKVVDPQRQPQRPFIDFTWAFVLQPAGTGSRLLVRVRYDHSAHWWVARAVDAYELVDAMFSRRMLMGIRARAEGPVGAPDPRCGAVPGRDHGVVTA